MNFTISSSTLLNRLQSIGRVVPTKSSLSILENFLLHVKDNQLSITASDTETTLNTNIELESSNGEILIALQAKLLMDTLKEFPEQPLTFEINPDNYAVEFHTENGNYSFIGQNGDEFPKLPTLEENFLSSTLTTDILLSGVSKTIFATATNDLRPTMAGIYFNFATDGVTFVATDAHKLVRLTNDSIKTAEESSFILPKKPAILLKTILASETGDVKLSYDNRNIIFDMPTYRMICRQIDGKYPKYNNVIPKDNPFKVIADRQILVNAIKRVATFANQGTNLVKFTITSGKINLTAQDIDFSNSAEESIACQYDGDDIQIGFKATLLIDILNAIPSSDIIIELADPSRAGIILPFENEENEDVLMLLMPMIIND